MPQSILRSPHAEVTYTPDFLPRAKATRYLNKLQHEVPWETERVRGKEARRKVCSFGDPGVSYRYAGGRKQARPWTPTLEKLRRKVEAATGLSFNYVLLNCYEDGRDYIGYHADDTRDLQQGSTIASLSLGAERDFLLKPSSDEAKAQALETRKVRLAHGSLLCMGGATQQHYKHSVPARPKLTLARVNATWRQVVSR